MLILAGYAQRKENCITLNLVVKGVEECGSTLVALFFVSMFVINKDYYYCNYYYYYY